MEQDEILKEMLQTLSEALNAGSSRAQLEMLYERQRESYHRLCSRTQSEEEEGTLICARCLMSALRALLAEGADTAAPALQRLSKRCKNVREFRASVRAEMQTLAQRQDPVSDAVLVSYASLAQVARSRGRESV